MGASLTSRRLPAAALSAALAAAVAGCALNPPPTADELQRQALPHTSVPAAWKAGGVSMAVVDRWLASFDDPALSALVDEALAYNADLQVAAARVEQAAGYVKVANASLLPSVGVLAMGGGKSGGSGGLDGIWLNASLELDVWGRVRYGSAAAEEQSAAVAADYAYARQSLAATVSKAWFLAIEAGLQRGIAQDALRSTEELLRIAKERLRVGSGNEQAVAEARVNVGTYRDKLRQLELAREQALRALELLLGRYPAAEITVAEHLSPMPPPMPVGTPSQLLERRPDVIAAERRVAAAFDRVGEARAAQLPRISLTAGGSSVSSELIELKDTSNPIWSFGGNLIAPLYQGGALRAQVEIRSAEQKQAVAEYARAGQRAFGEVESALAAENALRDREVILAATIRDSQRALELAQVQYRVGSADLRAVEQNQLALYSARISLLRVQTERLAQRVNLYLALGGGFDLPAMAPVAAQ
jgi:outer membrane protein, multidrug efflux system